MDNNQQRIAQIGAIFDPFPFPLLSMILALEVVLFTAFVLIRQNRMSLEADQRSHLNLQIYFLAERRPRARDLRNNLTQNLD